MLVAETFSSKATIGRENHSKGFASTLHLKTEIQLGVN